MKKLYTIVLTVVCLYGYQISNAQVAVADCNGIKGPNLLGAKGTFSKPFIKANTDAANCAQEGSNTFNPVDNVGNGLLGCSNAGILFPCSDYVYTAANGGLIPEFRYSILKIIGDNNGGNCMKGEWRGKDHTGDGGYFMAVNGAPFTSYSNVVYQIKSIPVCIGAIYEFSAWVINLVPGNGASATSPNISFEVNGEQLANSGLIPATNQAQWFQVKGSFTAKSNTVDLKVVNATSATGGNDLGLDDISFNICESRIEVNGNVASSVCDGTNVSTTFVVSDVNQRNTWYKWQTSVDGGITFKDSTSGAEATFTGDSYTLPLNIGIVKPEMNGYKVRLAVSTSLEGLVVPACIYYNDYTLIVASCAPLPVLLSSFNGRYDAGKAYLEWQTSQEINVDRFELYRSADGLDFIKVASVRGAGNSSSIKNYNYEDNIGGNSGNYVYYRIKQIDIDGRATFSSVVKLTLGSKSTFDIFPNPFKNNFTVSFGALKTATAVLRIQNSAGTLVYSKTINVAKGNNSIVMNNLPTLGTGVYYITVYNEGLNFTGKLQRQ